MAISRYLVCGELVDQGDSEINVVLARTARDSG
jgi:hypothetical protein